MQPIHDIKNKLTGRLADLREITSPQYAAECKYFMDFLRSDPYLHSLLETLDSNTSVDFFEWDFDHEGEWYASLPDTEEGRAKVCHGILQRCVQSDNVNTYLKRGRQFGRQPDSNLVLRQFTDGIIRPLVNYLCERIEDGGNVLYLLDRFKMRCEWFKQEELHEQYVQTPSMGEKNLDKALREYLFDGGIQFPLPQPESPSGKADVIASLGTADPLVLEVKIFDPAKHKSTRNLQGGFQQIWKYVGNYNQSIGYLFIFNCSDKELVIEPTGDLESGRPNRVEFGGKIFFIVVANVNPNIPSASRQSPTDRVTITHEQLTATATD